MNEYALIKGGVFVEVRSFLVQPDDIPHKGIVWLPVVRETVDSSTQPYINSAVVQTIEPTRYLIQKLITDKTPAEITAFVAALKDGVVDELDITNSITLALGKVLFDVVNEVRVLKAQAPLTPAQFKAYVRTKL